MPLDAHARPLLADRLGRADAVHVVDDGAAAERRAGEHGDLAALGGREAAAEVELEHPRQLELVEVRLVAVAAHLEHEHRAPGARELGGDHAAAGAGARRRIRRPPASALGPARLSTGIVFGACSGEGGGESGPGIADRLPVRVLSHLVGQAVEEQEGHRAQLADAELRFGRGVGDRVQQRRAPVEVGCAEALGGDRVEQLAERLDLLGQRGLREQALDLGGDAEIRRAAGVEVAGVLAASSDGANVSQTSSSVRRRVSLSTPTVTAISPPPSRDLLSV